MTKAEALLVIYEMLDRYEQRAFRIAIGKLEERRIPNVDQARDLLGRLLLLPHPPCNDEHWAELKQLRIDARTCIDTWEANRD